MSWFFATIGDGAFTEALEEADDEFFELLLLLLEDLKNRKNEDDDEDTVGFSSLFAGVSLLLAAGCSITGLLTVGCLCCTTGDFCC